MCTWSEHGPRNFVKRIHDQTKGLNAEIIQGTLAAYKNSCLKDYKYDKGYGKILKEIKASFPASKIIVVICPIHESLFHFQASLIGENQYACWLDEIKKVFNNIIDFNEDRSIVSNPRNFFDPAHFYPFIGDIMLVKIMHENRI
jgi:hypothetical protein